MINLSQGIHGIFEWSILLRERRGRMNDSSVINLRHADVCIKQSLNPKIITCSMCCPNILHALSTSEDCPLHSTTNTINSSLAMDGREEVPVDSDALTQC